jgi:hypothetical protein
VTHYVFNPPPPLEERFPDDIDRMVRVLAERGHSASRADLASAWEAHSESYAAGWLSPPEEDDDLVADLMTVLAPDE